MRKILLALACAGALTGGTVAGATPPPGWTEDGPVDDGDQHGAATGHLPASNANVELLGKLKVTNVEGGITDVAVLGNTAFLGAWRPECATKGAGGFYAVDIKNPASPVLLADVRVAPGSYVSEGVHAIKVDTDFFEGGLLAVDREVCSVGGRGGFELWDVTNPAAPAKLGEGGEANNSYHSVFAWQAGSKAYLIATDNNEPGFGDVDIFDITNPRAPVFIAETGLASWPGAKKPDAYGNGTQNNHHDSTVRKIGSRWTAIVAYWDTGYVLLDVNDPANPLYVADSDYGVDEEFGFDPAEGNAHYGEYDRKGRLILAADEDFSPYRTNFRITSGPNAGEYPAGEFGWTVPLATKFPGGFAGTTVFGGLGCDPATVPPKSATGADAIVFSRGVCFFSAKVRNAELAGYEMVAIGQSHGGSGFGDFPDSFICGAQGSPVLGQASAICIGHRSMHLLFGDDPAYTGVDTADMPPIGTLGASISARPVFDGWGYLRLIDGATLETLDTYAVAESKDEAYASGFGVLSIHEPAVSRNRDLAYVAYYSAGFRVVDFSTGKLREVGHFIDQGGNDLWGVELAGPAKSGGEIVAASDRDFGLYLFRYTGP